MACFRACCVSAGPEAAAGVETIPMAPASVAFARTTECASPDGWAAATHAQSPTDHRVPIATGFSPLPQPPVTPSPHKQSRKSPMRTALKGEPKAGAAQKADGRRPSGLAKASKSKEGASAAAPITVALPPLAVSAVAAAPSADEPTLGMMPGMPPSLGGKLDLSAIEDELKDDEEEGLHGEETAEEKRLRRMRRNRESAAMSRNRKKQYVEELEAQLAQLQEITRGLQTENSGLRQEVARISGAPLALPAPVAGSAASLLLPPPTLVGDEESLEDGLSALNAEDLIAPILGDSPEPPASSKRAGSPLLGGGAKRASTASLAFISAITLVTFTINGGVTRPGFSDGASMRNPRGHSPTARMLMSITEAALPWSRPVPASYVPPVAPAADGAARLWPSLGLDELPASAVHVDVEEPLPLPLPAGAESAAPRAPAPMPAPRGWERVIRAPQNSSWQDVLRIEAAEKRLAEAQLEISMLRHAQLATDAADAANAVALARPHAAAATQPQQPVYEYKEDDEALPEHDDDAQRFIFCSRAYMFDAPPRVSRRKPVADLDLPSAMPARFRDAATFRHAQQQRLQQISDGGNASAERPVVNILLPSAALQGVVGDGSKAPPAGSDNELMQVQCQVLNASRLSPTPA